MDKIDDVITILDNIKQKNIAIDKSIVALQKTTKTSPSGMSGSQSVQSQVPSKEEIKKAKDLYEKLIADVKKVGVNTGKMAAFCSQQEKKGLNDMKEIYLYDDNYLHGLNEEDFKSDLKTTKLNIILNVNIITTRIEYIQRTILNSDKYDIE